jgi:hypothetical protein
MKFSRVPGIHSGAGPEITAGLISGRIPEIQK